MKPKTKRKLKRIFSFYHIAVALCIIVSVVSIIMFIKPDFSSWFATKYKIVDGVKVIQTDVKADKEVDESYAKRVGVKQFKELGENLKESDLTVRIITRKGENYYYITSEKNTMEIRIKGGAVTRVNAVPVE